MAGQSVPFAATGVYGTQLLNPDGTMTWPWIQQFQQAAAQFKAPVSTAPPATSAAPGQAGQIATDGDYLYVWSATTQSWKRIALNAF